MSKRNKAEQAIHGDPVDNILDESQVEASLAQSRRDYLALAPAALSIVKGALEGGPVDRDVLSAAFQVLKGTGVHGDRTRSRNDVQMTQEVSHETDEQLDESIAAVLPLDQKRKA